MSSHKYKTKHDRYQEKLAEIDAELPPVDIGQFENIKIHHSAVPVDRVLALAMRLVQGASIRDACTLANVHINTYKRWARLLREYENGESETIDPYILACAMTMQRARAITRLRWQLIAEAGGTGSGNALWMLERRGGAEYRAPAQRHEVKRETTEVHVHATIEDALSETAKQLGIDAEALKAQGDYWAKAITASQRGQALPAPPANTHDDDD